MSALGQRPEYGTPSKIGTSVEFSFSLVKAPSELLNYLGSRLGVKSIVTICLDPPLICVSGP